MAVDQQSCPGREQWKYTHGFRGIDLDEDETVLSRSRTERCWTASTLSMPSKLKLRFRLRKLEMSDEFACIDSIPKDLAKIILQDFELHGPE